MKKGRLVFNLFIVWLLTGIWHGANYTFLVWGMGYFLLLMAEKFIIKPDVRRNRGFKVLWRIVTLLAVNFGWVIFNSADLRSAMMYCCGMLGGYGSKACIDGNIIFSLREYGVFILCGLILAAPLGKTVKNKSTGTKLSYLCTVAEPAAYLLLFIWAVSFLVIGAHNPFIYWNF